MQEVGAQAVLEPAPEMGEGLTTSLPRSEVEHALSIEDAPLELILDLTRFADGEPTEARKIAVAWERADLERALQETEGDRVDFTFDRDALWKAMEEDVEAHGFREKVIVLAVAVTAASGVAHSAAAEPGPYFGAGGPPIHSMAPDDRAVSRAIPTPEPTVGVDNVAYSDHGVVALPPEEATMGVDDRAVSRAIPTPEPTVGASNVAYSDHGVVALPPERTTAEPVGAADAGSWAPSPAETAAIGGAIALAITGAAFLVTGRRHGPETRPA